MGDNKTSADRLRADDNRISIRIEVVNEDAGRRACEHEDTGSHGLSLYYCVRGTSDMCITEPHEILADALMHALEDMTGDSHYSEEWWEIHQRIQALMNMPFSEWKPKP